MKITAESLQGNHRLKAIALAGVGVDNIDTKAATRQGIVVMNTPGGNTISTAEQTLALMYGLVRNIAAAHQSLAEGRWDRKKFMGTQLAGKTLGIVGLGRIGQAVAARAVAMEMRVVGYDPFVSAVRAKELGMQLVASAAGTAAAGRYPHRPHAAERADQNLIGTKEIQMMKKGVRRSTRCGGIYDEAALVEGLKSGQWRRGPGRLRHRALHRQPLVRHAQRALHAAPVREHGRGPDQRGGRGGRLLIDFFTSGAIKQSVNMSPLDPKTLESLRGYLNVAYRLGLLLAQGDHRAPTSCRMSYKGEVAKKDTRLLSQAFAAGLLAHAVQGVNIVNAEVLLRERGIELVEQRSTDVGDFSSLITAEVVREEKTSLAAGTLFGNNMPRLVQKNGCRLES